MTKKRKVGILLILIGIGIPSVLFFFLDDYYYLNLGSPTYKVIERKLTPTEIEAIEEKMATKEAWRKELSNKIARNPKALTEDIRNDIRLMLALPPIDKKLKENVNKEIWVINSKVSFVIPFKYFVGLGVALILIGIGFFLFSFFPKAHMEEESRIRQTKKKEKKRAKKLST